MNYYLHAINMILNKNFLITFFFIPWFCAQIIAQHSVARQWNEEVLEAIRDDFARPTVHARNLFHISAAMYDAWAVYEPTADTYFLGKTNHGFTIPFRSITSPIDVKAAQEKTISYAVYRLIEHRFQNAPDYEDILSRIEFLMYSFEYDRAITSTDYNCGAAELGNYIAQQIILFGLQDGSNEINAYDNIAYQPVNPPLVIASQGNPDINYLDRWQPLLFSQFIDQSGNPIGIDAPAFLSPEWGSVLPFSLQQSDVTTYNRDGFDYLVYHDPGPPVYLNESGETGLDDPYKWGHTMVSVWSSHLDPADTTLWDISPSSIGNISDYPSSPSEFDDFYNFVEGGDKGEGYDTNPITGAPYAPNLVKRSDYARILAEFWADGPDSETPPGHWFTILNEVNDDPALEKRFMGQGAELEDLEWDVKSYFLLGGAMHDVAISAWGIKGWYDYVRPVSSIRGMSEYGQGSDASVDSYHPFGLPLIPGYVELIEQGDPLQGAAGENIGKIKIYAWRGPEFIEDPKIDVAGVDWILAGEWWPYQRPTFVTPPFAGYISGHSTFSRAAAEVLTMLTGDPYFPGGMGEFSAPKNDFLVFEEGPTEDVILQWATYRDASDQCSLSRIWGGIHPPVDDIPGRLIGKKIGIDAFNFALPYFDKTPETIVDGDFHEANMFPNPTDCGLVIEYSYEGQVPTQVYLADGRLIFDRELNFVNNEAYLNLEGLVPGIYFIVLRDEQGEIMAQNKIVFQ